MEEEVAKVPQYVTAAYLLNPYIVCSCVAMTTTVFANFILSLTLLAMAKKSRGLSTCCLALSSHQFYPVMLVVPIAIATAKEKQLIKVSLPDYLQLCILYSHIVRVLLPFNGKLAVHRIYLWLHVPDLTPNIGLFWYFFTEMFDHFYLFFTYVFQFNPLSFIYVIPLAIRVDENVPFLSFTLCAIMAIFKSYPSIADVGFYLAFIPVWNHLVPFFRHSFIVGCIFLVTSVLLSPILGYLWIYTGSVNANFFFATKWHLLQLRFSFGLRNCSPKLNMTVISNTALI